MVAALKPQPAQHFDDWLQDTQKARHVAIVLSIWRCRHDNDYWPDVAYISKEINVPPFIVSADILVLIQQKVLRPKGSGYKLIVRRELP